MLSFRGRVHGRKARLVVYGNADTGYRLGAQAPDKSLTLFGKPFTKQTDAVNYGQRKFGQKPGLCYPKPASDKPKRASDTPTRRRTVAKKTA